MTESHEAIFSKWEACERLAKDQSTTPGERNSARKQAERLKLKLDELAKQRSINLSYESYVEQGRQAVKTAHGSQWVLGALSHNIVIEYGKRQLQQFADDIGAAYSTLRNCRSTWQAWPDVHGRPRNFSVAEVLNPHPDRYKIVAESPDLTVRQAAEIVKLRFPQRPRRSEPSPGPGGDQQCPMPLTLDQAREVYVALVLKLSKKDRNKEAIELLNMLGVTMKATSA